MLEKLLLVFLLGIPSVVGIAIIMHNHFDK